MLTHATYLVDCSDEVKLERQGSSILATFANGSTLRKDVSKLFLASFAREIWVKASTDPAPCFADLGDLTTILRLMAEN